MAAMLLAFALVSTILAKMIPVIGQFYYWRFSLTPSVIMFSSLLLGPLFGSLIGAMSDLIPALVYPTGAPNLFITLVYAIYGALPWLLVRLTKFLKGKKACSIVAYALMLVTLLVVCLLLFLTDWVDFAFLGAEAWAKPLLVGVLSLATVGLMVGLFFTERYYKNKCVEYPDLPSPSEIAIVSYSLEIVVMAFGKSLAFYLFYFIGSSSQPLPFMTLALMLLSIAPINVLLETFAVNWALVFFKRFNHHYGSRNING